MQDTQSVSAEEIARFDALAPQWWDPNGPMRPLHRMNPLRIAWITARLPPANGQPLLDIGCGAGIATEPLARAGFRVTGLDAAPEAIAVARTHAAAEGLTIDYRVGLAAGLLATSDRFVAITALEIIEHVPDPAAFLNTLAALLEPSGQLFVSTLNRTLRSLAIAKIGAEYIARLLPAGTHDWRKFIKPEELATLGRAAGLRLTDISGMIYTPATGIWSASRDSAINYIAAFTRD